MAFYDLPKEDRNTLVKEINSRILLEIKGARQKSILSYFSDEDTYIRKTAYLAIGKIYVAEEKLKRKILKLLAGLAGSVNEKIRQTVVNAAGEIGKKDFDPVEKFSPVEGDQI